MLSTADFNIGAGKTYTAILEENNDERVILPTVYVEVKK